MLDIFLDSYENENNKISLEMIKQNFEVLLLAGIDTYSHVACKAIYNLAKHPSLKNQLKSKIYKKTKK
jgi:cytochrome P450